MGDLLLNVRFGHWHIQWTSGHLPHLFLNQWQIVNWSNIRFSRCGKHWLAVYEPFRWHDEPAFIEAMTLDDKHKIA